MTSFKVVWNVVVDIFLHLVLVAVRAVAAGFWLGVGFFLGYLLSFPVGWVMGLCDVVPDAPLWRARQVVPLVYLAVAPTLAAMVLMPGKTDTNSYYPLPLLILAVLTCVLVRSGGTMYAEPLGLIAVAGILYFAYWNVTADCAYPEKPAGAPVPQIQRAAPAPWQPAPVPPPVSIRFLAVRARYDRRSTVGMTAVIAEMEAAVGESLWGSPHARSRTPTRNPQQKNGILLAGSPGNGKSFLAEVMAGIHNVPIIMTSIGDAQSKWIGQTTETVVTMFNDARAQAPCILFLDEVDSFLGKRDSSVNADSETPKTTNAILTQLVAMRGTGVCVMAATNFPEKLDTAAIREGRFDFKITVPCPDQAARVGLLCNGLRPVGVSIVPATLDLVAARWEGFSTKRIMSVADTVGRMHRGQEVNADQLYQALRKVQGFSGSPLREDTPSLASLFFEADTRDRILGLAARMRHIIEIEAAGGAIPSGVLLYGPPGTGKTLAARALAKETAWTFIPTTGQTLMAADTEIDRIIDKALDLRPALIFIDEADDVLMNRETSPYARMTINKLLASMDGADRRLHDVIFLAATNHPGELDPAMLRGGRFSEKIEFHLPSDAIVRSFVETWMKAHPKVRFTGEFNLIRANALLRGLSLATIGVVLKGAINRAFNGNTNVVTVTLEHLRLAVSDVS